ncbi:hypothetical protein EVAR_55208_1 [Eumeta japonica]|uniref:Uncharacterized protein n=1 Tax=Eumeta variegata TaxID=151549 RepID=A0A4C1ZNQ4_EUMVA|nr:hypothetical protein EVAR_55208_1 [Eumeta japonica]
MDSVLGWLARRARSPPRRPPSAHFYASPKYWFYCHVICEIKSAAPGTRAARAPAGLVGSRFTSVSLSGVIQPACLMQGFIPQIDYNRAPCCLRNHRAADGRARSPRVPPSVTPGDNQFEK